MSLLTWPLVHLRKRLCEIEDATATFSKGEYPNLAKSYQDEIAQIKAALRILGCEVEEAA